MPTNLKEEEVVQEPYNPEGKEKDVSDYLEKRLPILKQSKRNILDNRDFEEIMRNADIEYAPNTYFNKQLDGANSNSSRSRGDELTGLRGSSVVNIDQKEGDTWRSDVSDPTLFVKIQTALSILVDRNPEAVFEAMLEKYKPGTKIAQAMWMRSWKIADSKDELKLFIFNLAKYGWAIGRTYPRKDDYDVEILDEFDPDNEENNKYVKKNIVEFNDVYRENRDPWRTWIDDMATMTRKPDDWYFEDDFSKDTFMRKFGHFKNAEKITFGTTTKENNDGDDGDFDGSKEMRDDLITLGFYESKNKDLYAIYSPKDKVVLHFSPLPNDEKKLSCWQTVWSIRDPRSPYGIGLYETIKGNKVIYDRLKNMTIDQLVMAIYPMLFYTGQPGDDDLTISPAKLVKMLPGSSIDQVNINYDPRGFDAIDKQSEQMDEDSGVNKTLEGQLAGKTLGETLEAKDASLRRLGTSLKNIATVLEDEAKISLSWMNQIYSRPEVVKFLEAEDLAKFEAELGRKANQVNNNEEGELVADFFPELNLGLDKIGESEEGDGGQLDNLVEAPEDRAFIVGRDIDIVDLKWEGKIFIKVQSILRPSPELERQRKLELYNVTFPAIMQIGQSLMQGMIQMVQTLYKPLKQILEIQDEKPKDWLTDEVVKIGEDPEFAKELQQGIQNKQQEAEKQQQEAESGGLFTTPDEIKARQEAKLKGGGQPQQAGLPQGGQPQSAVTNPLRKVASDINKNAVQSR